MYLSMTLPWYKFVIKSALLGTLHPLLIVYAKRLYFYRLMIFLFQNSKREHIPHYCNNLTDGNHGRFTVRSYISSDHKYSQFTMKSQIYIATFH